MLPTCPCRQAALEPSRALHSVRLIGLFLFLPLEHPSARMKQRQRSEALRKAGLDGPREGRGESAPTAPCDAAPAGWARGREEGRRFLRSGALATAACAPRTVETLPRADRPRSRPLKVFRHGAYMDESPVSSDASSANPGPNPMSTVGPVIRSRLRSSSSTKSTVGDDMFP